MSLIKNRFPRTFWAANSLELFERWAYYGVFNLLALYLTGSHETGALGFTQVEKGLVTPFVQVFDMLKEAYRIVPETGECSAVPAGDRCFHPGPQARHSCIYISSPYAYRRCTGRFAGPDGYHLKRDV